MSEVTGLKTEDYFTGMFPNYAQEYRIAIYDYRNHNLSWVTTACNNFCKDTTGNICKNFLVDCTYLGRFLHYIFKRGRDSYTKERCKYFFLKLKLELVQKGILCEDFKSCFRKLVDYLIKQNYLSQDSFCSEYVYDVDSNVLPIFNNLDKLSKYLYEFGIGTQGRCHRYIRKDCDGYLRFLINSEYMLKENFYKELDKILRIYKRYCPESDVSLLTYLEIITNEEKRKRKLFEESQRFIVQETLVTDNISDASEVVVKQKMSEIEQDARKGIKERGLSKITSGVFFSFLAIIIMTLIFYKYTSYGAILQRKVGKLRRNLNKKNKHHINIMDSSEFTQNYLFNNKYKITYTSSGYR
ncbi:variable surface protein [Plasmodium gonderi]|uniref:Variable surface protein n=1 Tax=Plasmodium gonderi TaxID=77519 RepID=A0A1Y1JPL2_PLAGO|nr:variable surface protein [Plasmodium gonderi]GAW84389.1 variable surface protein [Plasmodium gonderi]